MILILEFVHPVVFNFFGSYKMFNQIFDILFYFLHSEYPIIIYIFLFINEKINFEF